MINNSSPLSLNLTYEILKLQIIFDFFDYLSIILISTILFMILIRDIV